MVNVKLDKAGGLTGALAMVERAHELGLGVLVGCMVCSSLSIAPAMWVVVAGRALQGLALVTSGAVAEGMRGLDEVNAAVVAGELRDLVVIGVACCYLIAACERVRDYDRATQWCTRLKAFCTKWGLRPLFAVCRTQYASICMWRGTWLEAEEELTAATDELSMVRPAMVRPTSSTASAIATSISSSPWPLQVRLGR